MARDNEKWKARKREWADRNRQKIADNKRRYVLRNVTYLNKVKSVPCTDCGKQYPSFVMDLDHINGQKDFNISHMARWPVGLARLKREIEKCEVICSNCHRYRTFSKPS